jgi:signal transduction histidine kinase
MKRVKLFLLILSIGFSLSAQQHLADSIQMILEKELPDTTRAYNMVMLAMYTEQVDINKAHAIYKEAVDFSLSRNLNYFAGLALYYEVTLFHQSGNRIKEKENLSRAIDLLKNSEHPKAKAQIGAAYGGLANYYQAIEKTDSAVIASLNSIKILEELKKYRSLAISCMNLAMTYQRLKLPEKQKEYVEKGINYARLSGDDDIIMLSFLQKAHYLTELKDFAGAKACADSATPYFNENYDFSRKQNYFLLKAGTFQNVNQFDSAVFYFQKSYENAKQIGSRWNMTEPLIQIGYINLQQKKYKEAERFVKMGLEIAENDSILVFMKEGYGTLSDIYSATGKYKEAFELLGKFNEIKDSLQSEERKKFALDLEKKYEVEKHASQIRELEAVQQLQELSLREKIWIIQTLAGILFTLILAGFLLMRNYRQKQKLQEQQIQKLEAEKLLSATEAVLKGEEQERSRLAKDLHDGLGGLLSGIKYSFQNMKENLILTPENAQVFERSLDMLDSSIQEMRRVAHNLMPETLFRFGLDTALRDFCSNINSSGVLQVNYQSFGMENFTPGQTVSISVYRVIQELVNNIIKHAEAGFVLVQITRSENFLLIDVEDNGKGFDTEMTENQPGMGWKNIRSRIEYLQGTIDLKSQPGNGASVHIEIRLT